MINAFDRPSIPQDQIDTLGGLISIERRWTIRELSFEIGLSHQTVCHIIKKCLNMREIAALRVPQQLIEIQKWH
ncbi:hypothetical protein TNCT_177311 [Trichonephila clavata]|uniref:Uncharacterized protein n=1 Tax=Trichonephila clavata TaxID=2740835 RepID=A0A8X6L1L4_TRICU|nr:hypothetical protein TNCT_177311 [Trichonephila clavata]